MVNLEYKQAAVEVLEILDLLTEENKNKIPKEVIDFLEKNKDEDYLFNINEEEIDNIEKLDVKQKTKEILAGIYIDYLVFR